MLKVKVKVKITIGLGSPKRFLYTHLDIMFNQQMPKNMQANVNIWIQLIALHCLELQSATLQPLMFVAK